MLPPKDPDNRYSLPPARTYAVPGGPLARDLGEVSVVQLAEIIRGGDEDRGVGDQR